MDSSAAGGAGGHPGSPDAGLAKTRPTLGLVIWAACLGTAVGVSLYLNRPQISLMPGARAAFHAAAAAAYFAVFSHCVVRLACSRSSTWLFYAAGFGALWAASTAGAAVSVGLARDPDLRELFDLLRTATLPVVAALMLAGTCASRAGASKPGPGAWRRWMRAAIIAAGAVGAWRLGVYGLIGDILHAARLDPRLILDIVSTLVLAALLHRICRSRPPSQNEMDSPLSYWCVAALISSASPLAGWLRIGFPLWQVAVLELAGACALLFGLSLAIERPRRRANEQLAGLQAVNRIAWSLVGVSDAAQLSSALVSSMAMSFDANCAAVYLRGENDDEMAITASVGIDDASVHVGKVCSLRPDRRPGFHCGHTARAIASGEVQIVSEIFSDVEFLPWRAVAREQGLVVSVPLRHQERTIGAVNLFITGVSSIPESRVKLLESVALAVSPVIADAEAGRISRAELPQAA